MKTDGRVRAVEILLVEDNPGDVRLTREAFKECTFPTNLSVAADGVEALAFLQRDGKYVNSARPDLILLDLNLPSMNGGEVLKTIKDTPDLRCIPVVVLSTSEAESDIRKAYDLHANCYITKPMDYHRFRKIIQTVGDFWLGMVRLPPPSPG